MHYKNSHFTYILFCVLQIVVAETFEKIVYDPTKDVLIHFFSPHLEDCKRLAPIFEELAYKVCFVFAVFLNSIEPFSGICGKQPCL